MTVTSEEARRLFRNNTGGWLGVVQIGPTGAADGHAVEPGGTVWLSERECRLTAHAPRLAQDNPFLAQKFESRNTETGDVKVVEITPLTIVEDERAIPTSDRFIPGEEGISTGAHPDSAPIEPPVAPQPPLREPETAVSPGLAPPPPPVPPAVQAAVQAAEERAEEERAALATPDKEETGAAVPPASDPAKGEYAQHEEVGTPDAPQPPIKPYVEGP